MPSGPQSLDRATAMLPKLYRERLDEAGIDVGIVYSTSCLPLMHVRNDEMRQVGLVDVSRTGIVAIARGADEM